MRVSLNNLISKCAVVSVGVLATFGVAVAQLGGGSDLINKSPQTKEFVENRGQWDSRALFVSSQPGLNYWVTRSGIKVDMYKLEPTEPLDGPIPEGAGETGGAGRYSRSGHVVAFDFVGAGATSEPWGYKQSDIGFDYFIGPTSRHARDVRSYGEAYIKSLMPGVHVRNYLENSKPRYDVVVEAGVDPTQIAFDVKGADRVYVDGNGDLVIETDMGQLKHSGLLAYQPVGNAQKIVDAQFVMLSPTRVGIQIGAYDPQLPVIIDPLVYGTYVGSDSIPFTSSGYESVFGVQADDEGNLFVTGETSSVSFPITDGPYGNFSLGGALDAFIIRLEGDSYDTSYVAYLGGSGSDSGAAIGFHRDSGDLWVMGSTDSADFAGAVNALTGADDIFLSKFSVAASGVITPVSSWYYGGAGDGATNLDMVVSNAGRVFFTGANTGLGFTPYLPGATGGMQDGFVASMDSTGTVLWERLYGSVQADTLGRMDVDTSGNVLVTGSFFQAGTQDTATAGTPAFVTTAGVYPEGRLMRNGDIFVLKLDGAGSTIFASLLGGSSSESGYAIASDFEDNIYVSGQTSSFDYPRNQGAYEETPLGSLTATKISADGTQLLYSTGLRTNGPISVSAIDVDGRGILTLGGTVSWAINPAAGPPPPGAGPAMPALPGSITVVNGLDGTYDDGDDPTFNDGSPTDCPPSNDGFVIFLNSAGTNVLYADYIGEESNESVNDIYVDSVGATWIAGFTQGVVCLLTGNKTPNGIAPYITTNAFKGNAGFSGDGFLIKMRVELPIVNSITLTPQDIAGGLGVTSTATINLRDPAPTGGVTITVTLSNADATSFTSTPGTTTTTVNIAAGQTSASTTIFTFPVTAQTTSDVRAILDNDFVEERLTIKPWLDDFSVSPATLVGGNQITVRVTLFQNAIVDTAVSLSTDRPDLVTLSPSDVIVPAGAKTVAVLLDTAGVITEQDFTMNGSLLGVAKSAPVTLTAASVQTLSFNPPTVNGGSDSTGTLTLDGKAGADRTVTISHIAGETGLLIDGNALPWDVVVPDQESQVQFTVTTPFVSGSTFTTLRGSDGTTSADGTLFIDDIDIAELVITPATDVISGTVLTGQVKLTRAAGAGGFSVNLGNSNPAAGALSAATVDIAEGSLLSDTFTFTADVVSADEVTTLSASKPGFTTRNVVVTVRALSLDLALVPTTVKGGVANSTATITLSAPAPVGGLTIALASSDTNVATVPPTVDIAGGGTTVGFTVTSLVTPVDRLINISATASTAVNDSENLLVTTPGIVSLVIDPSSVTGPGVVTGTVTLDVAAPAGGLNVALSATPSTVVSLPASVSVSAGSTTGVFNINASVVSFNTDVTVTATIGASVDNAILTIRSPSVSGITFSPPLVQGGGIAIGTITLDQPAPVGGLTVDITNFNTTLTTIIGSSTILIPEGSRTGMFSVQTVRVSRIRSVLFQGGPSGSTQFSTGQLYIKP